MIRSRSTNPRDPGSPGSPGGPATALETGPTPGLSSQVLGEQRPWLVRLLVALAATASLWYFGWLLVPGRVGNPWLYGLLVAAEMFNLVQAVGFWWTLLHDRTVRRSVPIAHYMTVDVLVPRYNEPVSVVEPVLSAALRLRGADVTVHLLDDGDDPEMAALAARVGARYVTREVHDGAKAGNINHALGLVDGEAVLVLDCDHVPHPELLRRTLGHLSDEKVAFVQTPQYYANADRNPVAAAAWAQQALFFGCIARGKDDMDAMFCCGTNVVFRRAALDDVGGFPQHSVTEDFELSLGMVQRGWRTAYVPEVLVQGLGPDDMASYAGQQLRWARGCLSALGRALTARVPLRIKAQYALSSLYFLSGWTVFVYLSLPIIRILTGEQAVAAASADAFLLHFAPYFLMALTLVAVGGGGTYSFQAFALQAASAWIHVVATFQVLLRKGGKFVVTPKEGGGSWQPLAVWPGLVLCTALVAVSAYGLAVDRSAGMLNNVAFCALHLAVIGTGISWALRPGRLAAAATRGLPVGEARWGTADGQPPADDVLVELGATR
ncbi:glycosyltransferase family 2 protein [Nocardioides bruguierae]|uniref:Glycosyltransferase n=1 Tax=Nocardioides bruguierae TaxID=2945102 RepID=A0A9X2D6L3_9ACTN|nr:glycosyltransferase [Nocardioides bruguierae]MCM0620131.1 glycosyltransferase [Nocardioides bruguierae]